MDAYLEFHNDFFLYYVLLLLFFIYTSAPLTLSLGFIFECNSFHYSIKRHIYESLIFLFFFHNKISVNSTHLHT